jgi:hypothetical protein
MIIHQNHVASTLTVSLEDGCDQGPSDESIGWRNVKIIAINKTAIDSEGIWYNAGAQLPPSSTTPISCSGNTYFNSSWISCQYCDPSCATCTGPLPTECTSCNPIGYYNSSGSCLLCHPTCKTCTSNLITACTTCYGTNYSFPNGQCLPNCPLVVTPPPYTCPFPCPIGQYLYPDNSCTVAPCVNGFNTVSNSNSGGRCVFKCPAGEFLLANGTCIIMCPVPFGITVYKT